MKVLRNRIVGAMEDAQRQSEWAVPYETLADAVISTLEIDRMDDTGRYVIGWTESGPYTF